MMTSRLFGKMKCYLIKMKFNRCLYLLAAFLMMGLCQDADARIVKGKVTCGDISLSNVIISDGHKFTKTRKDGSFRMSLSDSAKFVYVIAPSGYTGDWSSGAPEFYQKAEDKDYFAFDLVRLGDTKSGYNMIAVGDPQPSKEIHCD